MPFGQRSLARVFDVAVQANVLATDNELKIVREGIRMTESTFTVHPTFYAVAGKTRHEIEGARNARH
jgi:hypothetical protein